MDIKARKISVVATSYNNEGEIELFLNNIINQDCSIDEIIIADGGSSDKTIEIVEEYKKEYHSIQLLTGGRLNIAEGLNAAIEKVRNEIIFIAGIGNTYPQNTISHLLNVMETQKADIVSPIIVANITDSFSKIYSEVYMKKHAGLDGRYAGNHGSLIKKAVIIKCGWFYEKFIYAGEDAEFYELARQQGFIHVLDDELKVYWDVPHNWKELKHQREFYAIGDEQILGIKGLLKRNKKEKLAGFLIIMLVPGTFYSKTRIISSSIVLMLLMSEIYLYSRDGKEIYIMKRFRRISKYIYYIKHWRYLKAEYLVNREGTNL